MELGSRCYLLGKGLEPLFVRQRGIGSGDDADSDTRNGIATMGNLSNIASGCIVLALVEMEYLLGFLEATTFQSFGHRQQPVEGEEDSWQCFSLGAGQSCAAGPDWSA